MNAKKLKSGNWRVRASYQENGKQHVKSFTSPKKTEAISAANKWLEERKHYNNALTVKKILNDYIQNRRNFISPSTVKLYEIYKDRLAPIHDMEPKDLNSNIINSLINEWLLTLSPVSCRKIVSYLTSALRAYDIIKKFSIHYPAEAKREITTPTVKQVHMLLDNAREPLKTIIFLSAFGSLRRGEICALRYSDVHYDEGYIYIHADMVRDADEYTFIYKPIPKTSDSIRKVYLPKFIMDKINPKGKDGYIFPELTPDQLTARFRRLRDKLHLDCRLHDLRHFFAVYHYDYLKTDKKYILLAGGWSRTSEVFDAFYNDPVKEQHIDYMIKANIQIEKEFNT